MLLVRLLVLVSMFSVAAIAQKDSLDHEDVVALRDVTSTAVSPDGETVAYIVSAPRTADDSNGAARTELWLGDFSEGTPRPWIAGTTTIADVVFAPDSKSLIFRGRRADDVVTALFRLPLDGGEAVPLFVPESSIRTWALSPDGKRVAWTNVEVEDAARVRAKKKGFDAIVFEERSDRVRLFVADLDGSSRREVEVEGAPWELSFTPDGKKLATWISPTSRIDDRYMSRRLSAIDLASGKVERLVDNPGKVGNFAWSPDGRHLAYISGIDAHDPKESQVMVVASTGGEARNLTPEGWKGHPSHLTWRDDDTLLFLADEGCSVSLVSRSIESEGALRRLIAPGFAVLRDFSLVAGTSRCAVVAETARHPRELFTFDLEGDDPPQRRSHSNPRLAEIKFAPQRVVRYQARDGLEIEGILIEPRDRQDDRRYPMITVVHGGPEAHYANGWLTAYNMPGQLAAARGYAVFYPNYRSSTGRGVAFSKAGQGRSALEEFDDIVDGVEYLVESGLVDRSRVGITGGSYGGYASAWGATRHSEHFAAAVMFVGISDQISKVLTTDIPNESFLVHWRKRPWDDWMSFLESSPIYYIDQADTPILIAHGQDDPRVSVTQSMELYRALKIKGDVPVRLVLYPGEGHGNKRRAARLDYSMRQMRWFEHYLGERTARALPPVDLDMASPDDD